MGALAPVSNQWITTGPAGSLLTKSIPLSLFNITPQKQGLDSMNGRFRPGQIVKLDTPDLHFRSHWRYIILDKQDDFGFYALYCLRAPPYRPQDLGRIHRLKSIQLVSVWSP